MQYEKKLFMVLFLFLNVLRVESGISVPYHDVKMRVGQTKTIHLTIFNVTSNDGLPWKILFAPQHEDIIKTSSPNVHVGDSKNKIFDYPFNVTALSPGKSQIVANMPSDLYSEDITFSVEVYKSWIIETLSTTVGWIYFTSWSISFYPQIYTNYKRKSVVGLNLDFLAFNIIGYTAYSVFSIGLFYIPEALVEYRQRNPKSPYPVLLNDLLFTIHGTCAAIYTGFQALLYERSQQRLSPLGLGICGTYAFIILSSWILVLSERIYLLDFLYVCSYVKLVVTVTKYVPQVLMNYKRKSTDGWSIGNVLLDLIGGLGSLLQVILNSYNYATVRAIHENPTKFYLALLTIAFDLIFVAQHYVWYKRKPTRIHEEGYCGSDEAFIKKA